MTRVMGLVGLGIIAGLAAQSTALADDTSYKPNSCIIVRAIHNWTDVDERTAILETGPGQRYRVTFWAPCREMRNSAFARLERTGSMCLSRGDVVVFGEDPPMAFQRTGISERCVIDSIEKLPPRVRGAPEGSSY